MSKHAVLNQKDIRHASKKLGKVIDMLSHSNQPAQSKTVGLLNRVMTLLNQAANGNEIASLALEQEAIARLNKAKEKVNYKVEELQRFEDESPSHAETPGTDEDTEELRKANEALMQLADELDKKLESER